MDKIIEEIKEIVNRETEAWNTKSVDLLLSIFHPDMVWVWPQDNISHNPIDWKLPLGKFDFNRWKAVYEKLFSENKLVKNERNIVDIKISKEGDGAFAIVNVDTVWEDNEGKQTHWLGRAGKTYTKTNDGWKLIAHHGLLKY